MSRSIKKPILTITNKIDKDTAHKKVRRQVKMELRKDEPDEYIIDADTTELGLDDYGTKLGFESSTIKDNDATWIVNFKTKYSRK